METKIAKIGELADDYTVTSTKKDMLQKQYDQLYRDLPEGANSRKKNAQLSGLIDSRHAATVARVVCVCVCVRPDPVKRHCTNTPSTICLLRNLGRNLRAFAWTVPSHSS